MHTTKTAPNSMLATNAHTRPKETLYAVLQNGFFEDLLSWGAGVSGLRAEKHTHRHTHTHTHTEKDTHTHTHTHSGKDCEAEDAHTHIHAHTHTHTHKQNDTHVHERAHTHTHVTHAHTHRSAKLQRSKSVSNRAYSESRERKTVTRHSDILYSKSGHHCICDTEASFANTHTHTHPQTHIHTHSDTHTHIHTPTHTHAHTHTPDTARTSTQTAPHTHTHTHTHTHIDNNRSKSANTGKHPLCDKDPCVKRKDETLDFDNTSTCVDTANAERQFECESEDDEEETILDTLLQHSIAPERSGSLVASLIGEHYTSGWLWKWSPSIMKGWQKRYFCLFEHDCVLAYWDQRPTFKDQQPLGSFNLRAVQQLYSKDTSTIVIHFSERKLELHSNTSTDKDRWMDALYFHIFKIAPHIRFLDEIYKQQFSTRLQTSTESKLRMAVRDWIITPLRKITNCSDEKSGSLGLQIFSTTAKRTFLSHIELYDFFKEWQTEHLKIERDADTCTCDSCTSPDCLRQGYESGSIRGHTQRNERVGAVARSMSKRIYSTSEEYGHSRFMTEILLRFGSPPCSEHFLQHVYLSFLKCRFPPRDIFSVSPARFVSYVAFMVASQATPTPVFGCCQGNEEKFKLLKMPNGYEVDKIYLFPVGALTTSPPKPVVKLDPSAFTAISKINETLNGFEWDVYTRSEGVLQFASNSQIESYMWRLGLQTLLR